MLVKCCSGGVGGSLAWQHAWGGPWVPDKPTGPKDGRPLAPEHKTQPHPIYHFCFLFRPPPLSSSPTHASRFPSFNMLPGLAAGLLLSLLPVALASPTPTPTPSDTPTKTMTTRAYKTSKNKGNTVKLSRKASIILGSRERSCPRRGPVLHLTFPSLYQSSAAFSGFVCSASV